MSRIPPHAKPMVRPTLPPEMFLHPENKHATLLDMQTARSVAAKREFFISLIRLGTSAKHVLGRVQVKGAEYCGGAR